MANKESKSGNREELEKEFNDLWEKSKDIIQEWNDIKEKLNPDGSD